MPILNEKYIEDKVVQWALKHGFLTPKVRFAERGWPDRLFLSPTGHTIFIEFKDPAITKVEPLQNYRIMELRRRGIPAFYCNNVIEGINILKAALEPSPVSEESDSDAGEQHARLHGFPFVASPETVGREDDRAMTACHPGVICRSSPVERLCSCAF